MNYPVLARLAAFTDNPQGGNPAGVWIGEELPEAEFMQRTAKEVGYSETAFLSPAIRTQPADRDFTVRYYSPAQEVSFCGHATIAAAVLLGELNGAGMFRFDTLVGQIPVNVVSTGGGYEASLTSVLPHQETPHPELVQGVLNCLGWRTPLLDSSIPPSKAYAGAWHLVLAVQDKRTLDNMEYDFERLRALMNTHGLVTLQLVWRESETVFHSRNPFPVGGVVEDPATGAAAAALAGYLRDAQLLSVPTQLTILQGVEMGRPSHIRVQIPEQGGVVVSGQAVRIPQ